MVINPFIFHASFYLSRLTDIKRLYGDIIDNVYAFLVTNLVYGLLGTPVYVKVIGAVLPSVS